MKSGSRHAPGWTIDQAMQVMSVLTEPFRENGYTLALHGSVARQGTGNDVDLLAVPATPTVTPPEDMERLMRDRREIDMQYRLPAPTDWEDATRQLAYHLWIDRGCPFGSPEVDWLWAKRILAEYRQPSPPASVAWSKGDLATTPR
jgi:hypothetical protein